MLDTTACPEFLAQLEFNYRTIAWEKAQVGINLAQYNINLALIAFDQTQRYINALLLLWCMYLTQKQLPTP